MEKTIQNNIKNLETFILINNIIIIIMIMIIIII